MRFFLDIAAAFLFLFEGKGENFLAVFKAHRDFNKYARKMRDKRNDNTTAAFKDLYPHAVIWGYYFGGKKYFNGHNLQ